MRRGGDLEVKGVYAAMKAASLIEEKGPAPSSRDL
jgi:hypothetical protein